MVLLAQNHRGFDLVHRKVPAAPDDIAVASAFETPLRRIAALRLTSATGGFDLLKQFYLIVPLAQPLDAIGWDVSIDDDATRTFLDPHNNDPKLVPERA
jgi:hypothetical protein